MCESEARIALLTVQEIRKIKVDGRRGVQVQTELMDVRQGLKAYFPRSQIDRGSGEEGSVTEEKCYWSSHV